jgi:hypothetical protein
LIVLGRLPFSRAAVRRLTFSTTIGLVRAWWKLLRTMPWNTKFAAACRVISCSARSHTAWLSVVDKGEQDMLQRRVLVATLVGIGESLMQRQVKRVDIAGAPVRTKVRTRQKAGPRFRQEWRATVDEDGHYSFAVPL